MIKKTEQEIMENWKGDITKPIVSICAITYNHENYISEAIESFLIQETDFPFEIIIGDDCSTDRTSKIISQYSMKFPTLIKAVLREKNMGMDGRNNFLDTLSRSQGKYIALCEGDDYWTDPLKLQKQVYFLDKNEDYNMVFHNAELQNYTENKVITKPFNPEDKSREYTADEILGTWCVATASVLFRNEGQYRYLGNNPSFPVGDTPLFIKCASLGKLYYIAEQMSVYRRVPTGILHSKKFKSVEHHLIFIEYYKALYNNFNNLLSKKTIERESANHYLWAAQKSRRNGNEKDYIHYLSLAMAQDAQYIYEKEIQTTLTNIQKNADQKLNNLQHKYNIDMETSRKKLDSLQDKYNVDMDTITDKYNLIMESISIVIEVPGKIKPLQKISAYKSLTKTYFELRKDENKKK